MSAATDASSAGGLETAVEALTRREARGLSERLVVDTLAPGMFTVYSEAGEPYTVDVEARRCSCPDAEYNHFTGPCKHRAAAEFLTGVRALPEWLDEDSVRASVTYRVRDALDDEADVDRGDGVATDGGVTVPRETSAGEPVPVAADCPECDSAETCTSAFAASVADDLAELSAWCVACGHGFMADELADEEGR